MAAGITIGVDIGGTFTDLTVREPDGRTRAFKALTTPGALADGVIDALRLANVDGGQVSLFAHGTTAGLNALLERRFAPVGLLTTAGFRDVYELGRANRPAMYDLYYHRPETLVPRRLRREVNERLDAAGAVLVPLDEDLLRAAADALVADGVEAIAVVLLHAYANPVHELRVEALLNEWYPDVSVSLSHRVANEWREFERTSTTVVNAAVAPTMDEYLGKLERRIGEEGIAATLHIMSSSGGMTTAERARTQPVDTLLSGPVGGVIAAAQIAVGHQLDRVLALDMGGTSFDVSMILDGAPQIAREAQLEGQPLLLSTVDVHTVGSGGGSVGWAAAGGLRVGPRSAGAVPGPACYGRGGTEPTVTDANVHLGRVSADHFLGGGMALHTDKAQEALENLGEQVGLEPEPLAAGMLDIVNARMAGLVRQITVGRGLDPREFAIVAFGGAGPMHAIYLAEELGVGTVVVPFSPGTLSAQGMLSAELSRNLVQPYYVRWDRVEPEHLHATVANLRNTAASVLADDGVAAAQARFTFTVDLRYVGQEYSLSLAFTEYTDDLLDEFHTTYEQTFGHSNPAEHVEVVALRLTASAEREQVAASVDVESGSGKPYTHQEIRFRSERVRAPRFRREDLRVGQSVTGPLVVDEASCTTVIPDGWTLSVDGSGVLLVRRDPVSSPAPENPASRSEESNR